MKHKVSTSVVKLDLATILANYKKPEFWSKEWLIIDTKWISVKWSINYIDCRNNKIQSQLDVTKIFYKKGREVIKSFWSYPGCWCSVIPVNNKEYTQRHFEKNVYGNLIRLIESTEDRITQKYKEYADACEQDEAYCDQLRDIAANFLDSNNVSNEEIRNAYIEAYVDKMSSDRESFANKVLENFRGKILTSAYVYAAAWFGEEEDFKKYQEYDTERKSEYEAIKKEIKLIQTEAWKNSMKEQLEDI